MLRPTASNKRLAVVNVTVVNRTTTVIPLLVDAEAARLGDRRSDRVNAVDPFQGGVLIDAPSPRGDGTFADAVGTDPAREKHPGDRMDAF